MNATNLYVTTCRLVMQADPENRDSWTELYKLLPYLRQSLSCTVCGKLLAEPYTPTETSCQHHVCKKCLGGKKRLKPSCSWCKDYSMYVDNVQIKLVLQCYRKLCEYIKFTPIYCKLCSIYSNGGQVNLADMINEAIECTATSGNNRPKCDETNNVHPEYETDDKESINVVPQITEQTRSSVQVTAVSTPLSPVRQQWTAQTQTSPQTLHHSCAPTSITLSVAQVSPLSQSVVQLSPLPQAVAQVSSFSQPVAQVSPLPQVTQPVTQLSPLTPVPQPVVQVSSLPQPVAQVSSLPQSVQQVSSLTQTVPQVSSLPQPMPQVLSLPQPMPQVSSLPQPLSHATSLPQSVSHVTPLPQPVTTTLTSVSCQSGSTLRPNKLVLPHAAPPVMQPTHHFPLQTIAATTTTVTTTVGGTSGLTFPPGTIFPSTNLVKHGVGVMKDLPYPKHNPSVNNGSSMYSVMYADGDSTKITIKRKPPDIDTKPLLLEPESVPLGNQEIIRKPKPKPKPKPKRKGCRCGNATPTPGKLTCCGQRCPCYVEAKACMECRCRGCRNPHRPGGKKVRPVIPQLANIQIHQVQHVHGRTTATAITSTTNTTCASTIIPPPPTSAVITNTTLPQTIRAVQAMHAVQAVHGVSNVHQAVAGGMTGVHQLISLGGGMVPANLQSGLSVNPVTGLADYKPVGLTLTSVPAHLLLNDDRSTSNSDPDNSDVDVDI